MDNMEFHVAIVLIGLIFGTGAGIYMKFIQLVPDSYMDEIFHIPQAQEYCKGNFSQWNPKITTPPGLYLASVGILRPVSYFRHVDMSVLCSVGGLRMVNLLFLCGNMYLLSLLSRKLTPKSISASSGALNGIALGLHPVLFFFNFLYYTDPGSTFFVLLAYYFSNRGNHWIAPVVGAGSLFFRQTNIIWLGFFALPIVVQALKDLEDSVETEDLDDYLALLTCPPEVVRAFKYIVCKSFGYLCVLAGFCYFLIMNGGVVLGDKSAHQASFHVPQLLYCLCVSVFFSWPYFLCPSTFKYTLRQMSRTWELAVLFMLLFCLAAWTCTYEHPYLLADNRHFTFYIWAKFYRRFWFFRYLMTPVYVFCLYSVYYALKWKSCGWVFVYLIMVSLVTIPNKLLEPRYFVLPHLILRLNCRVPSSRWVTVLEILNAAVINAGVMYLFLYRPFKWPSEEGFQRFMW